MSLLAILRAHNPWWALPTARPSGVPLAVRRGVVETVAGSLLDHRLHRAVVVFGARRVGKTTALCQVADWLLLHALPPQRLVYFDFSDPRLTERVDIDTALAAAKQLVGAGEPPLVLLLDEVEHARGDWASYLKDAVDRQPHRWALTTSSAGHLRQRGRESGAGRWIEYRLEGLSFGEYLRLSGATEQRQPDLSTLQAHPAALERYLASGGFPESAASALPLELARRLLREDVVDRAIARDLAGKGVDVDRVGRLLVYLVQQAGAELVARARAADLGADARSVRQWLGHLVDTCLVVPLDRQVSTAAARTRSNQKIYPFDHALISAFSPLTRPEADADVRGRVLEAVVFRHLRQLADVRLSYFRDRRGLEVDFVIDGFQARDAVHRVAIEVTANQRPGARRFHRLARAASTMKADAALLVSGAMTRCRRDTVVELPLHELLLNPARAITEALVP